MTDLSSIQTPASALPPSKFSLRLTRHSGMLIAWSNQTRTVSGSFDQCEEFYNQVQRHNYLLGWWSYSSIITNPIIIVRNHRAMKKLQVLAGRA
jgi:hypothetical protein